MRVSYWLSSTLCCWAGCSSSSSRKVSSSYCLLSSLCGLNLNLVMRKALIGSSAIRNTITTILYGLCFTFTVQEVRTWQIAVLQPTKTDNTSQLPINLHPAAGRYFEILRWHVRSIMTVSQMKESHTGSSYRLLGEVWRPSNPTTE